MRTEAEVAAMPCPVCAVPLAMSDRQGVEIDYCPQCRGVWLDRGELDKIIERAARKWAGASPAVAPARHPATPSMAATAIRAMAMVTASRKSARRASSKNCSTDLVANGSDRLRDLLIPYFFGTFR